VTSILEALRELEEERRRSQADRPVSVADIPPPPGASSSLLYPLIAGLAVGVLVVGALLWWTGAGMPAPATVPAPSDAPPSTAAASARPTGDGLAWLERADAPVAHVERRPPPPAPPDATPAPAPPPAAGRAGSVVVESIRYAADPAARSVTLRLDGRRVTLRQGERAAGIEVQLILKDGAYLGRGVDVIFERPQG
jgi:hypothetical protein